MISMVAIIMLLVLYTVSIYTDIKYKLIKNIVTMPTILVGIFLLSYQHGLFNGIRLFGIGLILGLLLEMFRIWASGDTKLFVAGGLLTIAIMGVADFSILFYLLAFNLFLYLIIGHVYTLSISKFNFREYRNRLRSNQRIGQIAGAIPIFISNFIVLGVYFLFSLLMG